MNSNNLKFLNPFVDNLPGDTEPRNFVRLVRDSCYSLVQPTATSKPSLITYSQELAELLGISPETIGTETFTEVFAGNRTVPGSTPYAMCYGGHQFGHWAGQLGDGRAITLGEIDGKDGLSYALQLKGSGLTPYSRTADGLAVLRSSLREFVCSEAMHYLRVPTTRALSLIRTGDQVVRDMFYDGNPELETGAIVCRVAPTFLRFGNFEIFAAQRNIDVLKKLANFTIRTQFPSIKSDESPDCYVRWFRAVLDRTAFLMAEWWRVGFVHGVMNTDNMSITGLTIDYGPYGWLEDFDFGWTPNTTDAQTKRYTFGKQPQIAKWNLLQLANVLCLLVEEPGPLQEALDEYDQIFEKYYMEVMRCKLGLREFGDDDMQLVQELYRVFESIEIDMTLFFRSLANISSDSSSDHNWFQTVRPALYNPVALSSELHEKLENWLRAYAARVQHQSLNPGTRTELMNNSNPLYVPRNYLAQLAIDDADKGDYALLRQWMEVLKNPYQEQSGMDQFAAKRPDWARTRAGCSMLSCSS
ncbi:MAG: YdiU family protein [Gammaproteobacteria bacterium]|nr:YdiU family protein [Gammaproteobacteria bacterium]